jgi:PAS domain-containing protein
VADIERGRAEAANCAQQACEEAARLREALDLLPLPVWRRDCAGAVADCNRPYAAMFGIGREAALAESCDLAAAARSRPALPAAAAAPPVRTHVIIGGQRRLLEITELRCADGAAFGFALDRTDIENAAAELRRHLDGNAAVLEGVSAAVAIFGPDKRLKFHNAAFAGLWRLDGIWLASEPTLNEILERLREMRRLPEFADFRIFKKERSELFTSLIEPRHELMHLPDGRTLQLTISPHPFGGLIFVYEDVSDHLALECSYNTLIQVQRATLDHLFEASPSTAATVD